MQQYISGPLYKANSKYILSQKQFNFQNTYDIHGYELSNLDLSHIMGQEAHNNASSTLHNAPHFNKHVSCNQAMAV
jgi:hypothetical protein